MCVCKREREGERERKRERERENHSLQPSLWISLLSEAGPNILTDQGLLPGVGKCMCLFVCCCNVLAGHWLPIHKLGIPRWKRYVC